LPQSPRPPNASADVDQGAAAPRGREDWTRHEGCRADRFTACRSRTTVGTTFVPRPGCRPILYGPGCGRRPAPSQRTWTAEDGSARFTVEVVAVAEELGPSLRWATATPASIIRSGGVQPLRWSLATSAHQYAGGTCPPPLETRSFPHSRHSRYQPPCGLRMRCQRWSPTLQRQGLAMATSLFISRAGSVSATRRVQTRDSAPVQ
jgi:hypothetical protein